MWSFRRQNATKEKLVESKQAVLDADKAKALVEQRDPEVHQVSGALRNIRERNHFAEQLRVIIERG